MAGENRVVRWAKTKPMRATAWVAVIGILVGLVFGTAVGFKVEQHRVHNDVANLKTRLAGGTTSTSHAGSTSPAGSKVASGSGGVPVERRGTVTATGTNTITLATKQHGLLVLKLTGTTNIDNALPGTTADISAGRHVLVAKGGHDVIVLPVGRTFGRMVTKVSNGVASVTKITGVAHVPLSKVQTVDTTSPATAAAIKTGSHVLAWYQPAGKGSTNVIEVIVLPAGSAFA